MKALILHSFYFNVLAVHINFEIAQELTDTTRMYNRFRHILFSGFGTSLGKVWIIILSAALECAKKSTLWPLAKKVVHPCYIHRPMGIMQHLTFIIYVLHNNKSITIIILLQNNILVVLYYNSTKMLFENKFQLKCNGIMSLAP